MKNPATHTSKNDMNEFTQIIHDNWVNHSNKLFVRLRDGIIVQPVFKPAEDEYCNDAFYTEDYSFCWNLDGTNVTNSRFDMMEIISK